jgi:hypothetical protein
MLPDDAQVLFAKLGEAVSILKTFSPYHHLQLSGGIRVLVIGTVGPWGVWHNHSRMIQLQETWVTARDTHPVHVAATLVHELTHAWLDHRGVKYVAHRRRRIEAICYRAQARFVGRIPESAELRQYYLDRAAAVLNQSDDQWSNEAFRERDMELLAQMNTPAWIIRFLRRRDGDRTAV